MVEKEIKMRTKRSGPRNKNTKVAATLSAYKWYKSSHNQKRQQNCKKSAFKTKLKKKRVKKNNGHNQKRLHNRTALKAQDTKWQQQQLHQKIYGLDGNYIIYANTTIYVSISTYNSKATPNLNIEI